MKIKILKVRKPKIEERPICIKQQQFGPNPQQEIDRITRELEEDFYQSQVLGIPLS